MSQQTEETLAGNGVSVFESQETTEGTVRFVTNANEVIQLVNGDVEDVIGMVRAGTCSFASPLLSSGVTGLITMEGAPTSHLGILSREFNIPCVMSMKPADRIEDVNPDNDDYFQKLGTKFDGKRVRMDTTDGSIYMLRGNDE